MPSPTRWSTAEAEHRRSRAEAARAGERARLAAELHDVVTHHVTAMVVQAEAARYLTAEPDRLDQTLTAVTDTGRRAIGDLRHLLDVLDPGHDANPRTPTVGELHDLVEQSRRAGQPVEYVEEGTPLTDGSSAAIAAYRVVQEGLTNALKHAHGSRTVVRVHHGPDDITVEVSTDGPAAPAASPGGSGRGLAGLRERIGLLGGELNAGRQASGAFVVRARIPVEARSDRSDPRARLRNADATTDDQILSRPLHPPLELHRPLDPPLDPPTIHQRTPRPLDQRRPE